jgi:hypothetical protein
MDDFSKEMGPNTIQRADDASSHQTLPVSSTLEQKYVQLQHSYSSLIKRHNEVSARVHKIIDRLKTFQDSQEK